MSSDSPPPPPPPPFVPKFNDPSPRLESSYESRHHAERSLAFASEEVEGARRRLERAVARAEFSALTINESTKQIRDAELKEPCMWTTMFASLADAIGGKEKKRGGRGRSGDEGDDGDFRTERSLAKLLVDRCDSDLLSWVGPQRLALDNGTMRIKAPHRAEALEKLLRFKPRARPPPPPPPRAAYAAPPTAKKQRRGTFDARDAGGDDGRRFAYRAIVGGAAGDVVDKNSRWYGKFVGLKRYGEEHGNFDVPRSSPNGRWDKLNRWALRQRYAYKQMQKGRLDKTGGMNPARAKLLREIGFPLEPRAGDSRCDVGPGGRATRGGGGGGGDGGGRAEPSRWSDRYEELKKYREEHGSCDVTPSGPYVKLSKWARDQKWRYRMLKSDPDNPRALKPRRAELLDELDFPWDVDKPSHRLTPWRDMFEKLRSYKEEHGHFNPPTSVKVGKWACQQRYIYRLKKSGVDNQKTRSMSSERTELLESIGFADLDLLPPSEAEDRGWRKRLEELRRAKEASWRESFEELRTYREEQGHFNPPTSTKLGKWASQQRYIYRLKKSGVDNSKTKPMSSERVDMLESIGFADLDLLPPEEVRSISVSQERGLDEIRQAKEAAWRASFEELKRYEEENGHVNPPTGSKVGKWACQQRYIYRLKKSGVDNAKTKSMSPERVELLESIGFDRMDVLPPSRWSEDASAEGGGSGKTWQERLEELRKFKESLASSRGARPTRKEGAQDDDEEDDGRPAAPPGTESKPSNEDRDDADFDWDAFGDAGDEEEDVDDDAAAAATTEPAAATASSSGAKRDWSSAGKGGAGRAVLKLRNDLKWYETFEELRKYKEEHGHFPLPFKDAAGGRKLKSWMAQQRRNYRLMMDGAAMGRMTSERFKALDSIGFPWVCHDGALNGENSGEEGQPGAGGGGGGLAASRESRERLFEMRWNRRLEELRRYEEENGHFAVPSKTPLGRWAQHQRLAYNLRHKDPDDKRSMSSERAKRLEEIGFVWIWPGQKKRATRVSTLEEEPPPPPAMTADLQPKEVIGDGSEELHATGTTEEERPVDGTMEERPAAETTADRDGAAATSGGNLTWKEQGPWRDRFEELKRFKDANGHFHVPKGTKIYGWITSQRKQYKDKHAGTEKRVYLSQERETMLDDIGFPWVGKRGRRPESTLQASLPEPEGDAQSKGDDNVNYGLALSGQKKPSWCTKAWFDHYMELKQYKEEHGDCIVSIFTKLGRWVADQRYKYKLMTQGSKSPMTPKKAKMLEEVGIDWVSPLCTFREGPPVAARIAGAARSSNKYPALSRIPKSTGTAAASEEDHAGDTGHTGKDVVYKMCFMCRKYKEKGVQTCFCCPVCSTPLCNKDRAGEGGRVMSCRMEHFSSSEAELRCNGEKKTIFPPNLLTYKKK